MKEQVTRNKLLEAVRSRPGLTAGEYATMAGTNPRSASTLLNMMYEDSKVVKDLRYIGTERSCRWFPAMSASYVSKFFRVSQ